MAKVLEVSDLSQLYKQGKTGLYFLMGSFQASILYKLPSEAVQYLFQVNKLCFSGHK